MTPATAPAMSPVESEIDAHKTELSELITECKTLDIPDSCNGVRVRFLRDCDILINDLSAKEVPSSADLCDFVDRKHSLEIQLNNLVREYK